MASSLGLVFLVLLVLITTSTASPNITCVKDACSHTLHPDFCVESLLLDPTAVMSDTRSLPSIAIGLAANSASDSSSYSLALLQDGPGKANPAIDWCLNDCAEKFDGAATQLRSFAAALDDKAYDKVGTLVKAAVADATSCNDGCKVAAPGGSTAEAVTHKSEDFFKLCDIALVLTKLLSN